MSLTEHVLVDWASKCSPTEAEKEIIWLTNVFSSLTDQLSSKKDSIKAYFRLVKVVIQFCSLNSPTHFLFSGFHHPHSKLFPNDCCRFRRINDAPMTFSYQPLKILYSLLHLPFGVCSSRGATNSSYPQMGFRQVLLEQRFPLSTFWWQVTPLPFIWLHQPP